MKKARIGLGIALLAVLLVGGASAADVAVTIEGTINDNYQLVTDDKKVYEIAIDEKSEDLAGEQGKRVRVKCKVETDASGTKTISAISYSIIDAKKHAEE